MSGSYVSDPSKVVSPKDQLVHWVLGKSFHNTKGECCPDFSCCRPELRAPAEVRKQYVTTPRSKQEEMLVGFLGAMLKSSGAQVVTSPKLRKTSTCAPAERD